LKKDSNWQLPKDFITICQYNFDDLYNIVLGLVCRNPKILFESKDFLIMEENHLIRLLKCDKLDLEEIEIWKYLIKWGIKNTNAILDDDFLDDDLTKWKPTDFEKLKNTLHNCIPCIRFYHMSPRDYSKIRNQFKSILPSWLDDEIDQYFLDHKSSLDILPLRKSTFNSKIINNKEAALIAS